MIPHFADKPTEFYRTLCFLTTINIVRNSDSNFLAICEVNSTLTIAYELVIYGDDVLISIYMKDLVVPNVSTMSAHSNNPKLHYAVCLIHPAVHKEYLHYMDSLLLVTPETKLPLYFTHMIPASMSTQQLRADFGDFVIPVPAETEDIAININQAIIAGDKVTAYTIYIQNVHHFAGLRPLPIKEAIQILRAGPRLLV
jgi:hypothetical protein